MSDPLLEAAKALLDKYDDLQPDDAVFILDEKLDALRAAVAAAEKAAAEPREKGEPYGWGVELEGDGHDGSLYQTKEQAEEQAGYSLEGGFSSAKAIPLYTRPPEGT